MGDNTLWGANAGVGRCGVLDRIRLGIFGDNTRRETVWECALEVLGKEVEGAQG